MSDETLDDLKNRLKPLKLDTDLQKIRDLTAQVISRKYGVVQPVKKKLTRLQELIFECSTRSADSGCWEWRGAITVGAKTGGYGKLGIGGGKAALAHQVAFAIFKGPIPAGMGVLHDCDNRKCFNPAHLYTGTQADNMRDCYDRGRGHVGSDHSNAKFDKNEVLVIRRLHSSGTTMNQLARMYPATRKTIQRICWNESYRYERAAAPQVRRRYTKHISA